MGTFIRSRGFLNSVPSTRRLELTTNLTEVFKMKILRLWIAEDPQDPLNTVVSVTKPKTESISLPLYGGEPDAFINAPWVEYVATPAEPRGY